MNFSKYREMIVMTVLLSLFGSQPALSSAPSDSSDMLSVSKTVELNAAPATVWKMIGGYNHLDVWHPAVVASELAGSSKEPGTLRMLTLGNNAVLREELISHSDNNRSYSYKILESPFPVVNYVSTITVSEAGRGMSQVIWESTFNAAGDATDKDAVETITGVYDGGLNSLAKHFNN